MENEQCGEWRMEDGEWIMDNGFRHRRRIIPVLRDRLVGGRIRLWTGRLWLVKHVAIDMES